MTNLFDNLPSNISEELTEVLLQSKHVRIERIVSSGQASPDDSWYDQSDAEWVVRCAAKANYYSRTKTNRFICGRVITSTFAPIADIVLSGPVPMSQRFGWRCFIEIEAEQVIYGQPGIVEV